MVAINKIIDWILPFPLIFILIICINCSDRKVKENIESKIKISCVIDLFNYAYEYRSDSNVFHNICNIINDSLFYRRDNSLYALRTANVINIKDNIVDFKFIDCFGRIPHFSKKYTLKIQVKDSFLIIDNDTSYSKDQVKNLALKFLTRSNSDCNCYVEKKVDYFGIVSIPKGEFLLSIKLDENRILSKSQWELLFGCIEELFSANNNRMNNISNEKWGINYEFINIRKKEAIVDVTNFLIFIVFYYPDQPNSTPVASPSLSFATRAN